MVYEPMFGELDEKQFAEVVDVSQKILAIDEELIKINDARLAADADLRKKENFLNTEKGRLQVILWKIRRATLAEVPDAVSLAAKKI